MPYTYAISSRETGEKLEVGLVGPGSIRMVPDFCPDATGSLIIFCDKEGESGSIKRTDREYLDAIGEAGVIDIAMLNMFPTIQELGKGSTAATVNFQSSPDEHAVLDVASYTPGYN